MTATIFVICNVGTDIFKTCFFGGMSKTRRSKRFSAFIKQFVKQMSGLYDFML